MKKWVILYSYYFILLITRVQDSVDPTTSLRGAHSATVRSVHWDWQVNWLKRVAHAAEVRRGKSLSATRLLFYYAKHYFTFCAHTMRAGRSGRIAGGRVHLFVCLFAYHREQRRWWWCACLYACHQELRRSVRPACNRYLAASRCPLPFLTFSSFSFSFYFFWFGFCFWWLLFYFILGGLVLPLQGSNTIVTGAEDAGIAQWAPRAEAAAGDAPTSSKPRKSSKEDAKRANPY